MYSERSTCAIGQYHELCALAAFRLPDQRTPLLAGMNLPSMQHASQCTFWRPSRWSRKARHIFKSTSDAARAVSRRWTVLLAPYLAGSSLHGAPIQRIHRIPSKHWRSSAGGRSPFVRRLRRGRGSCMSAHGLSVTARQVSEHLHALGS
jgi:hypothetical protein